MTQEEELIKRLQHEINIALELQNKERIRIAEVEVLRDNLKQKTLELEHEISNYKQTMLEAEDLKRRLDKIEKGDRQTSFRSGEDLPEPEICVEVTRNGEIYRL